MMNNRLTRRFLIAGLAGGFAQVALANAPVGSLRPVARGAVAQPGESLATPEIIRPEARPDDLGIPRPPELSELIEKAKLGGDLSICVRDMYSGRVLEAYQPDQLLPPASVAKAVTSLYALDALGAGYQFETLLVTTGPVQNGVINGDLILVGGGDPLLDTNGLAAMTQGLVMQGIKKITGQFRVWGGVIPRIEFLDPTQPVQVGYNPTVSGLVVNFNRVHFEWRRSNGKYRLSMDARSDMYQPPIRMSRISIAQREAPTYIYEDGGTHDIWSVAQKKLGGGGTRWLPVRKPDRYAAEVMAFFLKEAGITVETGDPLTDLPEGQVLVEHASESLSEILKGLLKYSNNLTAELCGMAATRARTGQLIDLPGSAEHMSKWAQNKLGMLQCHFADHSGLHASSRMNAGELSRALANVSESGLWPLLKPIAIRDENGRKTKGHPLEVMAKTGTLFFTSSLAGYIRERNGRDLAFAIFSTNEEKRAGINTRREQSPAGASAWNGRAKRLQQDLLKRWGNLYV